MTPKTMILLAASAAALVLPAAAGAQPYNGQTEYRPQPQYDGQPGYGPRDGQRDYGQSQYGQPRGDWRQTRRRSFAGYPQFRRVEANIRQEIQDGVRDDILAGDDAADLMGQLRQIQMQEYREYRVHGWNLPNYDQMRIGSSLDRLDQLVDQTRNEP